MKVFVAGATGVIGHRAVARLVEAGHEVTGVARTEEKAGLLQSLGATPIGVGLFDAAAVRSATGGFEAVVNLATKIPPISRAALPGAWSENDRIRSVASANLAEGARAGGAGRYVQESIAFIYEDGGDRWLDEDTPLRTPAYTSSVLDAEGAAHRFAESGGAGIVLRFAQFYAADSSHSQAFVKSAKRRIAPAIGHPDAYVSSIHADDAASAVVAALAVPSGTYNVGEDQPVTRGELAAVVAAAIGVKPPRFNPTALAKLGGSKSELLMRSQRISNTRFKQVAGWSPSYPSVREGWPAVVAAMARGERTSA